MKKNLTVFGALCALAMVMSIGCKQASGTNIPPVTTFTVIFDSQGGSAVAAITGIVSGTKISKPVAPTNGTEHFRGWYKEDTCTTSWEFGTDTVTANITLYAKWGYTIGDIGPAGGLIFHKKTAFSENWRYLEAAPADLPKKYDWGTFNKDVNGAGTSVGTGKANIAVIIAKLADLNETDKAAQATQAYNGGGKTDWFLPSKDELGLMYTTLKAHGLGDFTDDYYWASAQSSNDQNAWLQHFKDGIWYNGSKDNLYFVRPVRSF